MGEFLNVFELDHAIRQQAQRPALVTGGWITAGQCDKMGFLLPVESPSAFLGSRTPFQCGTQTLTHICLAHPLNRSDTDLEGIVDGFVRSGGLTWHRIGFEQDVRTGQHFS
jgi:hypothetical protein